MDSGFLAVKLGFRITVFKAQDSGFHEQKFPLFRNPDYIEYVGQSSNIFELRRISQTRIDRLHVILLSSYYNRDILS